MKTAHKSDVRQRVTPSAWLIMAACTLALTVGFLLSAADILPWLQTVYILGYIKTLLGIIKYLPQVMDIYS